MKKEAVAEVGTLRELPMAPALVNFERTVLLKNRLMIVRALQAKVENLVKLDRYNDAIAVCGLLGDKLFEWENNK